MASEKDATNDQAAAAMQQDANSSQSVSQRLEDLRLQREAFEKEEARRARAKEAWEKEKAEQMAALEALKQENAQAAETLRHDREELDRLRALLGEESKSVQTVLAADQSGELNTTADAVVALEVVRGRSRVVASDFDSEILDDGNAEPAAPAVQKVIAVEHDPPAASKAMDVDRSGAQREGEAGEGRKRKRKASPRPIEDFFCELCQVRGHTLRYCTANIDAEGFMPGCPMCNKADHEGIFCEKLATADLFQIYFRFVTLRGGKPPFRLPWPLWDINPTKWEEDLKANKPMPQRASFALRRFNEQKQAQQPDSIVLDPIWKDENWRNMVSHEVSQEYLDKVKDVKLPAPSKKSAASAASKTGEPAAKKQKKDNAGNAAASSVAPLNAPKAPRAMTAPPSRGGRQDSRPRDQSVRPRRDYYREPRGYNDSYSGRGDSLEPSGSDIARNMATFWVQYERERQQETGQRMGPPPRIHEPARDMVHSNRFGRDASPRSERGGNRSQSRRGPSPARRIDADDDEEGDDGSAPAPRKGFWQRIREKGKAKKARRAEEEKVKKEGEEVRVKREEREVNVKEEPDD